MRDEPLKEAESSEAATSRIEVEFTANRNS